MDLRRRDSICYMSLADAFLTRLRQEAESRTKSRMGKGVAVEVLPVMQDKQDFIYAYLTRLYEQQQGTFSRPKTFAKQTIYECERSNPCKGSSSGDPTKTRANGCSAYVSFLFEEGATVTACVVRSRLTHTGHDPNNREELRVSRIDLKLRFLIETRLNVGMKVSEVMAEVAKWNKTHGYTDHHNRRFFPTRQDIQHMASTLQRPAKTAQRKKPRKYDTLGKDNASQVIKTEFRDWCVFHQSRTTAGPAPRPLVVVLQSERMRQAVMCYGKEVVYVDKNFEGLRQYGSAVYVVVVCDEGGGVHPVAYIVTSDDEPLTFVTAFKELHNHCPLSPRALMLDRDIHSFSEVLATLLPDTLFLLPWVQVVQEVHKSLQTCQGSGQESAGVRRLLLQCLQELRACDTKDAFVKAVSGLEGRPGLEGLSAVPWTDWLSHPKHWSDFGRATVCDARKSALWERSFLRLQHQFLKGVHTRTTLLDLLKLLTETVTRRRRSECVLEVSLLLDGSAGERAASLIKQGWSQLVTWQGEWVAHVPCHTLLETSYQVSLITMECECSVLTLEGPCIHLSLVSTLAQLRQGASPQQERQRRAREALQQGNYLLEADCCITLHSGSVCVTELPSGECTCVAAALDTDCVGVLLVRLARGEGRHHSPLVLTVKSEEPAVPRHPIVIQTHTGFPDPREPRPDNDVTNQEDSATSPLSSKALLEKLYLWSTSKEFCDSEILHGLLQAAHDSVWGGTLTAPPAVLPQTKGDTRGNKKLPAVVQPVKRKQQEEEEEEEEEEGVTWMPLGKMTRSGRTVKVKDEPDFVM